MQILKHTYTQMHMYMYILALIRVIGSLAAPFVVTDCAQH